MPCHQCPRQRYLTTGPPETLPPPSSLLGSPHRGHLHPGMPTRDVRCYSLGGGALGRWQEVDRVLSESLQQPLLHSTHSTHSISSISSINSRGQSPFVSSILARSTTYRPTRTNRGIHSFIHPSIHPIIHLFAQHPGTLLPDLSGWLYYLLKVYVQQQ